MEPEKSVLTGTKSTDSLDMAVTHTAEDNATPENGTLSPPKAPSPIPAAVEEEEKSGEVGQGDREERKEEKEEEKEAEVEHPAPSAVHDSPVVSAPASTASTPQADNGGGDKPKFKSPLLQKLVEGKDPPADSSGSPRFKSPLLQNLLGKTKVRDIHVLSFQLL
jgi:hypothetical protein